MAAKDADTDPRRLFAASVVAKLRDARFEALWAGGCVRDQLMGKEPYDYDVATSATPEEVRRCFGHRRTIAIGAAFGVITVLGSRREGQVEVATFRSDAAYSDGRHPDHVTFSTAREDALRRDFTINGLFYDPVRDEVIDYVGGQADLAAGLVRAIGDPFARFNEDKLRMLRAARFAAAFGFQLDSHTFAAIRREARGLTVVSAERIAAELRKMLVHANRARAVQLLHALGLLEIILPEFTLVMAPEATATGEQRAAPSADPGEGVCAHRAWHETLAVLSALPPPTFRTALAALLWGIYQRSETPSRTIAEICDRWKLSSHEAKGAAWLLAQERLIRRASARPWPEVQRVLVSEAVDELLALAGAVGQGVERDSANVAFCRERLRWPPEKLNPPPLVTGDDLRDAGIPSGPVFREILTAVRDAQLEGRVADRGQAMELARRIAAEGGGTP
ncbi:MAG: CCA tRNA nucleotidyltransferase [Planctomycetes bacterium]|nr:CCA tRNA nucleotidyltransferase [Planctomycetota bacterium]